jgi:hypothetical protein
VLATLAAAAFLAAPTPAGAASYDPPSWFRDGVAKLKARPEATCPGPKPFTRIFTVPVNDGVPPEPGQLTLREDGTTEDCVHRVPRQLAKTFPGLSPPTGVGYGPFREGCHGHISHIAPVDSPGVVTDLTVFNCYFFYRPVIRGRPNLRTWPCGRSTYVRHSYEAEGGETVREVKPYWFSHETKHWRAQRFKSLSRCLNPKYRKPK